MVCSISDRKADLQSQRQQINSQLEQLLEIEEKTAPLTSLVAELKARFPHWSMPLLWEVLELIVSGEDNQFLIEIQQTFDEFINVVSDRMTKKPRRGKKTQKVLQCRYNIGDTLKDKVSDKIFVVDRIKGAGNGFRLIDTDGESHKASEVRFLNPLEPKTFAESQKAKQLELELSDMDSEQTDGMSDMDSEQTDGMSDMDSDENSMICGWSAIQPKLLFKDPQLWDVIKEVRQITEEVTGQKLKVDRYFPVQRVVHAHINVLNDDGKNIGEMPINIGAAKEQHWEYSDHPERVGCKVETLAIRTWGAKDFPGLREKLNDLEKAIGFIEPVKLVEEVAATEPVPTEVVEEAAAEPVPVEVVKKIADFQMALSNSEGQSLLDVVNAIKENHNLVKNLVRNFNAAQVNYKIGNRVQFFSGGFKWKSGFLIKGFAPEYYALQISPIFGNQDSYMLVLPENVRLESALAEVVEEAAATEPTSVEEVEEPAATEPTSVEEVEEPAATEPVPTEVVEEAAAEPVPVEVVEEAAAAEPTSVEEVEEAAATEPTSVEEVEEAAAAEPTPAEVVEEAAAPASSEQTEEVSTKVVTISSPTSEELESLDTEFANEYQTIQGISNKLSDLGCPLLPEIKMAKVGDRFAFIALPQQTVGIEKSKPWFVCWLPISRRELDWKSIHELFAFLGGDGQHYSEWSDRGIVAFSKELTEAIVAEGKNAAIVLKDCAAIASDKLPKSTGGLILSFGHCDPLTILDGTKTVIRREYSDEYVQRFIKAHANGDNIQAYDKAPYAGGKKIADLRLTAVYEEEIAKMPASDLAHEAVDCKTVDEFIDRFFKGDKSKKVWVMRFETVGSKGWTKTVVKLVTDTINACDWKPNYFDFQHRAIEVPNFNFEIDTCIQIWSSVSEEVLGYVGLNFDDKSYIFDEGTRSYLDFMGKGKLEEALESLGFTNFGKVLQEVEKQPKVFKGIKPGIGIIMDFKRLNHHALLDGSIPNGSFNKKEWQQFCDLVGIKVERKDTISDLKRKLGDVYREAWVKFSEERDLEQVTTELEMPEGDNVA